MKDSLGCVVLGYPVDGRAPLVFRGSTDAVLDMERRWLADPSFAEVHVAAAFRVTQRGGASVVALASDESAVR